MKTICRELIGLLFCLFFNSTDSNAQPGTLDPSFNGTGYVVYNGAPWLSFAWDICVHPDGRILTAGLKNDTSVHPNAIRMLLMRSNPDGTPDQGFGSGGVVSADFTSQASACTLQADGKIVVAGSSSTGTQTKSYFTLIRLNPDGSFDNSFGHGGIVQDTLGAFSTSLVIMPDGRILAAGASGYTGGIPSYAFYRLAMHLTDGTPDPAFGNGGFINTFIPKCTAAYTVGMVIQPDGKILLGDEVNIGGRSCIGMARYMSDGTPDTGFGANGLVIDSAGLRNGCYKLAVQNDGKILVPAYVYPDDLTHPHYSLFRYNQDGTRDTTFRDHGMDVGDGGSAYDIFIQQDGKILTCGNRRNDSIIKRATVKRYLPDGAADITFGVNGFADFEMEKPSGMVCIDLCPDGKIAAGGYCNEVGKPSWRNTLTLRLNSFGTGIEESSAKGSVKVSPNPFHDFLTIETENAALSLVECFSVQGQKVASLKVSGKKALIPLGHLPNGVYFIKTLENHTTIPIVKIH